MAKANWTTLSKADTGFVFSHLTLPMFGRWEVLQNVCVEEFGCDPEDVDAVEDDDGREFLLVKGEKVIEIHAGYIHSKYADAALPVSSYAQAAE